MKSLYSFKNNPKIVLYFLGVLFVSIYYGNILIHPNKYMFSTTGDGIKNYYTYAYQITHGNSTMNFEGMNYPYGENILYTDCHPLLVLKFQALGKYLPIIQTHSVGILNWILILGIFLTLIVSYRLLIELKFDRWLSIIFAFVITLLAPQIFRIGGHYALSYSLAIPLAWWLYLKSKGGNWKWLLLLFFTNLFWLMIHAYLGVIVLSFLLMLWTTTLAIKKFRLPTNILTKQITMILLPIVLFYTFTKLTDTHQGRTDNPSGFLLYNAELDDVFLPHTPPLRPLLDKLTQGSIKLQWEAWGYVGMLNTLLAISLIILALVSFKKKATREKLHTLFANRPITVGLLASSAVMLFALGIPFRQFPQLLDHFPIVKQFRATGRFVWPFYFAFTIFGASVIQLIYKNFIQKRKNKFALASIIVFGIINLSEGLPYHQITGKHITENVNLFDKTQLTPPYQKALETIQPQEFQSIISLPFFYHGSENFSRPRQDRSVTNSMIIAYHTGLPMVNANLTRTSVRESKNIVQLISPNYYKKPIEKEITDSRDFLIVYTKTALTPYEEQKLKKGTLLTENKDFALYKISKKALFEDESKSISDYFEKTKSTFIQRGGFYLSDSTSFLYYQDYENLQSDTVFRGHGSYSGVKKGKNTLAEFPSNTFKKGQKYHASIWMYNGEKDALNLWFRLMVEEYDQEKDHWTITTFSPEHSEVINDNWSLVEGVFTVKNPKSQIAIVTKGKENSKANFHADDLLIRTAGTDVYKYEDAFTSRLFYNNHELGTH